MYFYVCYLFFGGLIDYENIVIVFKIELVWGISFRKKIGKVKKIFFYLELEIELGLELGMKGVIFYFLLLFVKKMLVFV